MPTKEELEQARRSVFGSNMPNRPAINSIIYGIGRDKFPSGFIATDAYLENQEKMANSPPPLSREERIREQARQNAADLGFDLPSAGINASPPPSPPPASPSPSPTEGQGFNIWDWLPSPDRPPEPYQPQSSFFKWLLGDGKEEAASIPSVPPTGRDRFEGGIPAQMPPPLPAPPEPEAEVDPTIAGIIDKKALLDTLYPQADYSSTPEEMRADAYAEQDMDRTKLLAQLALSAGITSQAGWGDVGKGLLAAGGAYDRGFARYQKALESAGSRSVERRNSAYKDGVGRTDAAIKMYTAERDASREVAEARRKENIDFLKEGYKAAMDGDFVDPEQANRAIRAWQYYLSTGELPVFVADEKSEK